MSCLKLLAQLHAEAALYNNFAEGPTAFDGGRLEAV